MRMCICEEVMDSALTVCVLAPAVLCSQAERQREV